MADFILEMLSCNTDVRLRGRGVHGRVYIGKLYPVIRMLD